MTVERMPREVVTMAVTETTEAAAEHATTAAALYAVFGPEADELLARIEHAYATSLASWRGCVDREVGRFIRTRIGAGG